MKKNLVTIIAMIGILFTNTMPGIASGSVVVDRVVAVVNDEIITLSDLQREEALKKRDTMHGRPAGPRGHDRPKASDGGREARGRGCDGQRA